MNNANNTLNTLNTYTEQRANFINGGAEQRLRTFNVIKHSDLKDLAASDFKDSAKLTEPVETMKVQLSEMNNRLMESNNKGPSKVEKPIANLKKNIAHLEKIKTQLQAVENNIDTDNTAAVEQHNWTDSDITEINSKKKNIVEPAAAEVVEETSEPVSARVAVGIKFARTAASMAKAEIPYSGNIKLDNQLNPSCTPNFALAQKSGNTADLELEEEAPQHVKDISDNYKRAVSLASGDSDQGARRKIAAARLLGSGACAEVSNFTAGTLAHLVENSENELIQNAKVYRVTDTSAFHNFTALYIPDENEVVGVLNMDLLLDENKRDKLIIIDPWVPVNDVTLAKDHYFLAKHIKANELNDQRRPMMLVTMTQVTHDHNYYVDLGDPVPQAAKNALPNEKQLRQLTTYMAIKDELETLENDELQTVNRIVNGNEFEEDNMWLDIKLKENDGVIFSSKFNLGTPKIFSNIHTLTQGSQQGTAKQVVYTHDGQVIDTGKSTNEELAKLNTLEQHYAD